MIFEGTLDRFPGPKIIAAHGGGYLCSYAARGDHACFGLPQNCNSNITLKKQPSEYLNQLYFDAMVFTPEGLRHLVAQVGASQVVLGTDHPIPWEEHPVDHVFATTTSPTSRAWQFLAATRHAVRDEGSLMAPDQPVPPAPAGGFRSFDAFEGLHLPSADLAAFEDHPTEARPQAPRT